MNKDRFDIMTPRERVLHQFQKKLVDRMPRTLDVGASPGIDHLYFDIFQQNTGSDDPTQFFDYDIRMVPVILTPEAVDFSFYYDFIPPETTFDAFGVGHIINDKFPLGYDLRPWKNFTSPSQIEDYPFPFFNPSDALKTEINRIKELGYIVSAASGSLNEWCYSLRGMDEFFIDLIERSEMGEAILNRVTNLTDNMASLLTEMGIDILCFYGDIGSQDRLLINPNLWHKWFWPRWQSIITKVHKINPQVLTFYHSCGSIEPIIPGIIKAGFDILNPIQPEAMDPIRIKKKYGNYIGLWGGIGMQSTMLIKDPNQVRKEVIRLVENWAPGGGTIVTLAQTLQPDVPWENVKILLKIVEEVSGKIYSS